MHGLDEEPSPSRDPGTGVIYQHPLAYLLGLEGIALLRAFAGEYDREFTLARIREIRALLDGADELGDGVEETPMTVQEGYAQWAPWYDERETRPEYKDEPYMRIRPDGGVESFSLRVLHGVTLQKFFTFSATHDAGLYQQVRVAPDGRQQCEEKKQDRRRQREGKSASRPGGAWPWACGVARQSARFSSAPHSVNGRIICTACLDASNGNLHRASGVLGRG